MGWPVGHPITLFPYYLTFKIARHIRDMYPTSVALPYQLSEAYLPLLLHLLYEFEQATMVGLVASNNICRATKDMVAILHAAHERIQLLASVSTADHDGLAPRLAYGVEELFYEYVQQVVYTLRWAIVDALALCRGAGGKFGNTKIFHEEIYYLTIYNWVIWLFSTAR